MNDSETAESTKDTAQAAGFYAAAYDVGNEIVISYRGTDGANDVWNGWTSIVGAASSQAELAAKFYHSIKAANLGKEIILTGHSLGDALAGFVGSLFGEEAVTEKIPARLPISVKVKESYWTAFPTRDATGELIPAAKKSFPYKIGKSHFNKRTF